MTTLTQLQTLVNRLHTEKPSFEAIASTLAILIEIQYKTVHLTPVTPLEVTMSTSKRTITDAEAETSANEWAGPSPSLLKTWLLGAIKNPQRHRDIGKMLANPAEIYVASWLREKTGRDIIIVEGKSYDCVTCDDKPLVRIQIKFRMDAWHLETTRRNSKKNATTNSTGHVAYTSDEFDLLVIFTPSNSFGIVGSSIRCIPVTALINPTKPDQLVTGINAATRRLYDTDRKTEEVIQILFQTLPLPPD